MSAHTIATAGVCALLCASPGLFWVGCNRLIEDHATLMTSIEVLRVSSLVAFATYMYVFYVRRKDGAWMSPFALANVVGVALILAGQWLNVLVYRRLGMQGVYYGYEYGLVPPDPTISASFPYNTMKHPQYIGCILTVLGLWAITAFNHRDRSVRWPVTIIAAVALGAYIAGIAIETPRCVDPPITLANRAP